MTRWEYYFTVIAKMTLPDSGTVQDLVNRLGHEGWELVGFDVHNQAWFKRPLSAAAAMEPASERQDAV
jgi:hypothetical protein